MNRTIFRGDIYFANLDPSLGCEQGGYRPALVVSNNAGNRHGPTVIVAAITSKAKPSLPTHLPLSGTPGIYPGAVVLLEQLRTIDKLRLGRFVGRLGYVAMRFIDAALATSLELLPPEMVMTLCAQCVREFDDTDTYLLSRIDEFQPHKEPCTLCSVRTGYDYEVVRK